MVEIWASSTCLIPNVPHQHRTTVYFEIKPFICPPYSCWCIGCGFLLRFCPLGSRHLGISQYSYHRQSIYSSLQRTPCGSYSNNKAWHHWNKWWQLHVDPSCTVLLVLPIFDPGPGSNWGLLWHRLFHILFGSLCDSHKPDSQVVPHLLWLAFMGPKATRLAHYLAKETSSHSPRVSSRDLLLYNNRLVELSIGTDQVLAMFRVHYWENNRSQAKVWWLQMARKIWVMLGRKWLKVSAAVKKLMRIIIKSSPGFQKAEWSCAKFLTWSQLNMSRLLWNKFISVMFGSWCSKKKKKMLAKWQGLNEFESPLVFLVVKNQEKVWNEHFTELLSVLLACINFLNFTKGTVIWMSCLLDHRQSMLERKAWFLWKL